MANWCSIEAEIVCFDGRDAETLYQKLLTNKTEADKLERGFFIGSDRYFFDSILEVNENTITLNGSVKWGFTDDEILAFIKHLKSVVPIKSAEIKYEETGCFIYGYFSYEDGILYDTYIKTKLPLQEMQREFYFMYFCQVCHLSGVISNSQ